jgi:NADPH-dependent 2,4-dienoyl-CoA reductase/sulfur reductase-like enzyme
VLEPADVHWYQPLWTLVGGGQAPLGVTRRPEASAVPRQVHWIREAATAVDPEARTVTTAVHRAIGYDHLVMAPGLQLDWDAIPGLDAAVGHGARIQQLRFRARPVHLGTHPWPALGHRDLDHFAERHPGCRAAEPPCQLMVSTIRKRAAPESIFW